MKLMIVGICGSPREQATDYALKEALRMLGEKKFETRFGQPTANALGSACTAISASKTRNAPSKTTCKKSTHSKEATGIIFATPVYNGAVSAQTKAIMDRCRAAVAGDKDFFKGKIGMGIACGGDRAGGQEAALMQIHTFTFLMVPFL